MWKRWQYWKGGKMEKKGIYINQEIKNIDGLEFGDKYPTLSKHNIEKVHNYVINQSSYAPSRTGEHVKEYFKQHAGDTSLSTVVTKVILVNTADSTNLERLLGRNAYEMVAKRIIDCDVENIISQGRPIDDELFKNLASWKRFKNDKYEDLNLFVFMSKYITRTSTYSYNGNSYSIMDKVVKDNLKLYNDTSKGIIIPDLSEIRNKYQYAKYCEIMGDISLKLQVTREMLDHFVWFVFKPEAVADKKADFELNR